MRGSARISLGLVAAVACAALATMLIGARATRRVPADGSIVTIADVAGPVTGMTALATHYSELATPIHILTPRGDRVLDAVEQAAALPAARLTLCEGRHMIPVTQPDLVARWITGVYARLRESDG